MRLSALVFPSAEARRKAGKPQESVAADAGECDLLCQVKRKRVKTTGSRHRFSRYPNLIKGMVISRLNQVWLSDITYIRIRMGFVYLAAILDAFSRKVIGYTVSISLDTVLTLAALKMAIARRQLGPGAIHHSDQGV